MSGISVDLFLLSVFCMLTIGVFTIVHKVWLPVDLEFEEIFEALANEKIQRYFEKHDKLLEPLGYKPFLTLTIINLQTPNVSRTYSNPTDPALFSVNIIGQLKGYDYGGQNYVAITTHLNDDSLVTTRNVNISSLLETPSRNQIKDFPGLSDLSKLKQRHDERISEMSVHGPKFWRNGDEELYLEKYRGYHNEFCGLNSASGLLRLDEKGGRYRATGNVALKGVLNFVNPFRDNFNWERFLITLLFGFVLPLMTSLYLSAICKWIGSWASYPLLYLQVGIVAITYGLAGLLTGLCFHGKTFIWGFLLGYFPSRLLEAHLPGWFLADIWLAAIADYVSDLKAKKENLI